MVTLTVHTWLISLSFILLSPSAQPDKYERLRDKMVEEQIQDRGIYSLDILDAMRTVQRHLFVPKAYQHMAYDDRPLPIGHGQTISQPFIVAYMTNLLMLEPDDKVLEIGTGSGYQAAVLAELVDQVYTIELLDVLGKQAGDLLGDLNYDNINSKIGNGYGGWEEYAPFDAIIVTAAADSVPPPLLDQLKEGGRMVIPVGNPSRIQMLKLIEKKENKVTTQNIIPVRFVPFVHED